MPHDTPKVKIGRRTVSCAGGSNPQNLYADVETTNPGTTYHLVERMTAAEAKQKRRSEPSVSPAASPCH
jgi:hypothetical protein